MYTVELQDQAAQPTLTIRTRSSVQELPAALGQAWGAIGQYLGELGQGPAGPPFAAYHNMDMADLDVEIGFAVGQPLPGRAEIVAGKLPAGSVVTCLHIGPYGEVSGAYEAMTAWMDEQGYAPAGPAYEFYLNDPQDTPQEKLETLVMMPVAAP